MKNFIGSVWQIKWHKSGIRNADDMEKKNCYTYIVYKWVLRNLLVFLFSGKEFDTMKYCPYCGGELANPAASFCTECGESLSSAVPEEAPVAEAHREKKKSSKKHVKKRRYSGKTKRPAVPVKAGEASEPVREDDYDGYYDDVRPFDEGGGREEIDKALVKKIILVVVCVLLIAGACVALMYLI